VEDGGEPKVADLEHVAVRRALGRHVEHVLGLEVPVHHAVRVAVAHGLDHLGEGEARVLLRVVRLARDAREHLAARAVVEDHVELAVVHVAVVHVNDVRVLLDAPHGLDLLRDARERVHLVPVREVDGLDGERGPLVVVAAWLGPAEPHGAEAALAQRLLEGVVLRGVALDEVVVDELLVGQGVFVRGLDLSADGLRDRSARLHDLRELRGDPMRF